MENYNSAETMETNSSTMSASAEVASRVRKAKIWKEAIPSPAQESNPQAVIQRETGDQINVYLLCVLVSKSSKRIKARAERKGVFLPMALVVRSILRAYRLSARDKDSPLAAANPNIDELEDLNNKVFQTLIKQWKDASANART
jgi:hypothetical protein